MSLSRPTSIKHIIFMALTPLLIPFISMTAQGAPGLAPFFQASEEYTLSYIRYIQLKTTAQTDMDTLDINIENLTKVAQRQSAAMNDFQERYRQLENRTSAIPSLIEEENDAIGSAQSTIVDTQAAAAASQYYKDGTDVSRATLKEKASKFQEKIDTIQQRIDTVQKEIQKQKNNPEYVTLISERQRLEFRKNDNLKNIQARGNKNTQLREQVTNERESLATWRDIQVSMKNKQNDIEANQLPLIESKLRRQKNNLNQQRRQHSNLIFEKQRLDNELDLKKIELDAESANLNQAEVRLNNIQTQLRNTEQTLKNEPHLRRTRAHLIGDYPHKRSRDRRGEYGVSIPEAQTIVAKKQQALMESESEIEAQEVIRAGKQNHINELNREIKQLNQQIQRVNKRIAQLEKELSQLGQNKNRRQKVEQALREKREQQSFLNDEVTEKVNDRIQLRAQRDAAISKKNNAQENKHKVERQLSEALRTLQRLNHQLDRIDQELEYIGRVRHSLPRLQSSVQRRQREVSTLRQVIQSLSDDQNLLLSELSRMKRSLEKLRKKIHREIGIVKNMETERGFLMDQLEQTIAHLSRAVEGEIASKMFIDSAESAITENDQQNRKALADNRQISEDLLQVNRDISLFEQTRIHPLQDQEADEEVLRDIEVTHRNTLLKWAKGWQNAKRQIIISEKVIEHLTMELADLKVEQAQTQAQIEQVSKALTDTHAQRASVQEKLSMLQDEITNIKGLVAEKELTLDSIVARLKEENQSTEPSLIDAVEPVIIDEGFKKISEKQEWTTGTVESHKLWNTKACIAYTTVVDGDDNELARLEVYAPAANENGVFSEPIVQVVVSNNSTPILDANMISLRWNRRRGRQDISLETTGAYLSTRNQNGDLQGLASRVSDSKNIVRRLRTDHTFRVTLNDAAGALMDLEFSLSGSSTTIKKAFEECELKFSELPEVQ